MWRPRCPAEEARTGCRAVRGAERVSFRTSAGWPSLHRAQIQPSHTPEIRRQNRPPHTGSCWAWLESRPNPSFMAVARKIKTLLTVNILVFVGIILFSVYCRIQDRSEELIQIGRIADQRLRARNGKVSNLVDRQSILQRLERLEDVVYNQLNGRKQLHSFRDSHFGRSGCREVCMPLLISVGFIFPVWWVKVCSFWGALTLSVNKQVIYYNVVISVVMGFTRRLL